MKNFIISFTAVGLFAWHGLILADAGATAEGCIDCHEVDEFEGMDAAALEAAAKEANANNKMQAVSAYLAAEANK